MFNSVSIYASICEFYLAKSAYIHANALNTTIITFGVANRITMTIIIKNNSSLLIKEAD